MAAVVGTRPCIISSFFALSSIEKLVVPVTFPPGRLRLGTRPTLIGSAPTLAKTIGIVAVAVLAAGAETLPPRATMASTLRLTRAAPIAGNFAYRVAAPRRETYTVRPSADPRRRETR